MRESDSFHSSLCSAYTPLVIHPLASMLSSTPLGLIAFVPTLRWLLIISALCLIISALPDYHLRGFLGFRLILLMTNTSCFCCRLIVFLLITSHYLLNLRLYVTPLWDLHLRSSCLHSADHLCLHLAHAPPVTRHLHAYTRW